MATIDPIVQQEQLMEATGYQRPADLERWLRREGIRYHRGKGNRIFTTIDAINGILDRPDAIEFE